MVNFAYDFRYSSPTLRTRTKLQNLIKGRSGSTNVLKISIFKLWLLTNKAVKTKQQIYFTLRIQTWVQIWHSTLKERYIKLELGYIKVITSDCGKHSGRRVTRVRIGSYFAYWT